jgi:hypothetical protein
MNYYSLPFYNLSKRCYVFGYKVGVLGWDFELLGLLCNVVLKVLCLGFLVWVYHGFKFKDWILCYGTIWVWKLGGFRD